MLPVSVECKRALQARSRLIKARVVIKTADTDIYFDDIFTELPGIVCPGMLMKLNIIEDINFLARSDFTPISSNEVRFVIYNKDRRFDPLNPKTEFNIFEEKQDVYIYFYVQTDPELWAFEEIPMGKFYLSEWRSDHGSMTASFIARDIFATLAENKYYFAKVQNVNLYQLAQDILDSAGVQDYYLDASLADIIVNGYMPIVDYKKALEFIATAGLCMVYSDRLGRVVIKRYESIGTDFSYITYCSADLFCGAEVYPRIDKGYEFKIIDLNNMYKDPAIELNKQIKEIEITVHSYTQGAYSTVIADLDIDVFGEKRFYIEFQDAPYADINVEVFNCDNFEVLNSGSNACLLRVAAQGACRVLITGVKVNIIKKIFSMENSGITKGAKIKIDNPLITSDVTARNLALWIMQEASYRAIYKINWRQIPVLECGDQVVVEDGFNAKKESRIIRNEYNYVGYLSGITHSKGGA